MPDTPQPAVFQLLTPTQAARTLGVHPQSFANWRAAGRGPRWCKLGSAVRYSAEALRDFYEANTQTATPRKKRAAK